MSNMQHGESKRPALDGHTHKIGTRVMKSVERGDFSGDGFVC